MQLTTKDYVDKGLNSPAFTGTPTAPTAGTGCDTRQIATCEFVQNAISDISEGIGNIGVYKKSGIRVEGEDQGSTAVIKIDGLTKQELFNLADDGYDLCVIEYSGSSIGSFVFMLRDIRDKLYLNGEPVLTYLISAGNASSSHQQTRLWFHYNKGDSSGAPIETDDLYLQGIKNRDLTLTAYKISSVSPVHGQVIKFTENTTWTVPDGVNSIDIYLVGAGVRGDMYYYSVPNTGSMSSGSKQNAGGCGGRIVLVNDVKVTPGQEIPITIGTNNSAHTYFGNILSTTCGFYADANSGKLNTVFGLCRCPFTGELYGLPAPGYDSTNNVEYAIELTEADGLLTPGWDSNGNGAPNTGYGGRTRAATGVASGEGGSGIAIIRIK